MHSMRVAVVPYDDLVGDQALSDEILRVTAALERQVIEHFAPIWDISAEIVACRSLDTVPPGYSTIVLTTKDLPLGRGGFHYPGSGLPGALVQKSTDWSISASHELLEMLADPTGTTTVLGPSLGDAKLLAVKNDRGNVVENESDYAEQGLVAYVKEVCDPVQCSRYRIDDVWVSDFVTPDFYVARSTGSRYSYSGTTKQPFSVLAGCYISWSVQGPDAAVYQAFGEGNGCGPVPDAANLKITKYPPAPALLSRHWLDANADTKTTLRTTAAAGAAQIGFPRSVKEKHGDRLRTEIAPILNSFASPDVAIKPYLDVIRRLAWDDQFYGACRRNPTELEQALRLAGSTIPPGTIQKVEGSQQNYRELLRMYEEGHQLQYDYNTVQDARLLGKMY